MKTDDVQWTVQKMCTDIDAYELIIEHEKNNWNCEQKRESWKWIVSYHGSIVARGSVNSLEDAKVFAINNVPSNNVAV